MKLKPILVLLALVLISVLVFGCAGAKEQSSTSGSNDQTTEKESKATAAQDTPTKEKPMVIDKENGAVKLYAEVNAKYFVEPTRHGVVAQGGSNCDKSVLTAFTGPADFYQALTEIGAKPGNNMKLNSTAGTIVEGDALKVTVDVDGKSYDFSDVIKSDPDKGWEPRFGGNLDNAKSKNTGCILCLDSCSVGITSNSKCGYKEFSDGKVKFYGKQEILKEDKKPVIVSFELKK